MICQSPIHSTRPIIQVSSVEGLSKGLGEEFKLAHMKKDPCMQPLTERRFDYVSAEAAVWRRD